MNSFASPGRPWHLWLVGLLTLAWNSFGGYDYIMSQKGDLAYMAALTDGSGFDAQTATDYFSSFPLWADALWAIGVWGAVAGSLLLLARSGFAYYAYVLSLCGMVGATLYQLSHPIPGLTDSPMAWVATGLVLAGMLLQLWYSKAMARRGVLR